MVDGNSDLDTTNDVAPHSSYQCDDNSLIYLLIDVESHKLPMIDGNSDLDTTNDVAPQQLNISEDNPASSTSIQNNTPLQVSNREYLSSDSNSQDYFSTEKMVLILIFIVPPTKILEVGVCRII